MAVLPLVAGEPAIYTRSLDVARQATSVKGQFMKPKETTILTQ
jgi:hypothetical protein